MSRLTWPSQSAITAFLNDTIETIGRAVEFDYVISSYACPICSLNPVTNLSVDPFCVLCSGEYWIDVNAQALISGHITWKEAENLSFYTGGKQFEGDCRVRLNYTDELLDILDKTNSVTVDGRLMKIDKKTLLGAPTVNRVILVLQEEEKENE